ncbi:hypothetical protein BHM03_00035978 [Ensete ventricosum]|nr:hypothetical protein BHM03_00035978 [Ensete ventricosum]
MRSNMLSENVSAVPDNASSLGLYKGGIAHPSVTHNPSRPRKRRRDCKAEMKVVAAYLLAVLGGNTHPSAGDLKSILESVGAEVDEKRVDLLLSEVKGKDVAELIAAGREKFASVPSGGAVAAVAVSAPGAGAPPAAEEPKKEEKVEEKEESDDDMGFSLFD